MKRLLILLGVLSVIASSAEASVANSGTLNSVLALREGKLFFNQTGSRDARPACATQDRWVIDMSTPGGQLIASTVLTALAQNKMVGVAGTGTCSDWNDTESVENVFIYS